MDFTLKIKNIVLIGGFQPLNFDKYFFIKNNLFDETQLMKSVFDPMVVQLKTDDYSITITLNQFVIQAINPLDGEIKINELLKKIISLGNLVNISAIGINFNYSISCKDDGLAKVSKSLFYNDNNKLFKDFSEGEEAMYGVYVSKNFKDSRLKLDVKPATLKSPEEEENVVNFAFNFHYDNIKRNSSESIIQRIESFDDYLNESQRIMTIYK